MQRRRAVFLVHGRAGKEKEAVGRLLERTGGLEIVILHEQPNEGRNLIQKFEDHAMASDHAVVLLTADDVGGEKPIDGAQPGLLLSDDSWRFKLLQELRGAGLTHDLNEIPT